MAISEQAVEAAARFLLDDNPFNDEDDIWQVPSIRDHYHAVARGALEAALPFLEVDAAIQAAYEDGKRVKVTGEPYEVWSDDSPGTLAFWDGYYGRPLRLRTWGARG